MGWCNTYARLQQQKAVPLFISAKTWRHLVAVETGENLSASKNFFLFRCCNVKRQTTPLFVYRIDEQKFMTFVLWRCNSEREK